jgi:glycosyltransferase involved in cell wall biosynthesis
MMPLITVFTPTYNRAYTLEKLYDSLKKQTFYNFEWLVVDDGSTDETCSLMRKFYKENNLQITYIRLGHGGKHRAINRGVREANGELFFIVDSDDWLTNNAIERIVFHYNAIRVKENFCGVCGVRCSPEGIRIGGECQFSILDVSPLDFRFKYKIKGDMAEVMKTDILKLYPFPEICEETFCPEALIWNRISKEYKFRYFHENIYICNYLSDGLSAKIVQLRLSNPRASMIYYSELSKMRIPFNQKVKSSINFWRFAFGSEEHIVDKIRRIGFSSIVFYPISFIYHLLDIKI